MKKKTINIKLGMLKYLFLLPVLLLTNCQNNDEILLENSQKKLTKDDKIISLMRSSVQIESNKSILQKGEDDAGADDNQCTYFLYPIKFEVYSGDNPTPEIWEINSDEELISFIDTLNTSHQFYIYFPITLLDYEGVETVINDLTELEGTLQMANDACSGFSDDDDDDTDNSDDTGGSDNDDDGSESDDDSDNSDDTGGSDNDDDGSGSDDNSDDSDNDDEYEYCHKNNKKVYICHKGNTICVSINAIWGHMTQHEEDYMGSCDE